jgi:hypothetical protein
VKGTGRNLKITTKKTDNPKNQTIIRDRMYLNLEPKRLLSFSPVFLGFLDVIFVAIKNFVY